jgi:two-component system phosphate regulon response regulator PhoB
MATFAPQKQILIVDRDVAAVEPLRQHLSSSDCSVALISDGKAAIASVNERPPHLLIVEWSMPGFGARDLLEHLRAARATRPMRLIILSGLAGEQDVIEGLNLGADDYIVKPFSLREVSARVSAVLRARSRERHTRQGSTNIVAADGLVLDTSRHRVTVHGASLDLRGVECRLLEFLMTHPGRAFNRHQLLLEVWGGEADVDERTVDVNVQRLRKLLDTPDADSCIQTVRGFGYRFVSPASQPL